MKAGCFLSVLVLKLSLATSEQPGRAYIELFTRTVSSLTKKGQVKLAFTSVMQHLYSNTWKTENFEAGIQDIQRT